jgi:DNA-binding CsgD family transcriptional regulator
VVTTARALALAVLALTVTLVLLTVTVSPDPSLWKLVLVAVALGVPGALGAALHPWNPVGWLLLTVGVVFAGMGLSSQLLDAGRGGPWATWVVDRGGALVVPLTWAALLLLPDGRLPSPRWRPVAVIVLVAQVATIALWSLVSGPTDASNPIGVLPSAWGSRVEGTGDWVLQVPFLLVVAAVAVRLRRPADRARLAGLLGAVAGFALLATTGRLLWPGGADALDVVGAGLLGVGLTVTLVRAAILPPPSRETPGTGPESSVEVSEVIGLSAREREVLELVADGMTNREIAERLFISPVTARNHVSRILTKLGLENRTQAAMWLARRSAERSPARNGERSRRGD